MMKRRKRRSRLMMGLSRLQFDSTNAAAARTPRLTMETLPCWDQVFHAEWSQHPLPAPVGCIGQGLCSAVGAPAQLNLRVARPHSDIDQPGIVALGRDCLCLLWPLPASAGVPQVVKVSANDNCEQQSYSCRAVLYLGTGSAGLRSVFGCSINRWTHPSESLQYPQPWFQQFRAAGPAFHHERHDSFELFAFLQCALCFLHLFLSHVLRIPEIHIPRSALLLLLHVLHG